MWMALTDCAHCHDIVHDPNVTWYPHPIHDIAVNEEGTQDEQPFILSPFFIHRNVMYWVGIPSHMIRT
jgi:hypothetical protein